MASRSEKRMSFRDLNQSLLVIAILCFLTTFHVASSFGNESQVEISDEKNKNQPLTELLEEDELAKPSFEDQSALYDMGQELARANDQLYDCKMVGQMLQTTAENPNLLHYAPFSNNALVALMFVHSNFMNEQDQDPSQQISRMVIGTLCLRAMNMWLLSNPPEYVTNQAQRFRDFAVVKTVPTSAKPLDIDTHYLMKLVNEGLKSGKVPELTKEGTGGAYFMKDSSGENVGVFKPSCEEPNAANNPRGFNAWVNGEGLKKGTKAGEGMFREVAAYLLDHEHFAKVPPTVMADCLHPAFHHPNGVNTKRGSLQMFVVSEGSLEDLGPEPFPVEEVQKISVLDLRLANADRHAGNILKTKDQDGNVVFVPIDHGYLLPDTFEDCTFDWWDWPQAKQPYSAKIQDYIRKLDAEADIKLLKSHGWEMPVKTARTLRISTQLLKKGTEKGLTAHVIGKMMSRVVWDEKSVLEEILEKAQNSVLPGGTESDLIILIFSLIEKHLSEVVGSQEL